MAHEQVEVLVGNGEVEKEPRIMASNDDGNPLRPQFGNRFLTDPKDVFEHNAWDNVAWDEEQEQEAEAKVALNSSTRVEPQRQEQLESQADQFWDKFYGIHQNKFFKDRHWLFTEFPELASFGQSISDAEGDAAKDTGSSMEGSHSAASNQADLAHGQEESPAPLADGATSTPSSSESSYPGATAQIRLFEVGCGVGNTVFPVLRTNKDPGLFMYCCDLSQNAINIVKESPEYAEGRCHAFVGDVTDPACEVPFPENSLDVIILIFVLSAISPQKMQATVDRLARHLKPGGKILFRDYGRYDLAQLRFKDGQCISDHFYARGDGTRVYFFTQEELRSMFTQAGLVENQNIVDRRLQVNRGRQLKMYRVWIQCKYSKPLSS